MARNLRRLRLERELSQEALAFEAKIDRVYMSALERGVRNPTLLVLDRLARVLKVPLAEIVTAAPHAATPKDLPRGPRPKRPAKRAPRT